MKPRAITGVGVASALGVGRRTFFDAFRAGQPAIAPDGYVEVPDFDPAKYLGDKGLRSLDRLTKLLLVTARLALHDARLKRDGVWSAAPPEPIGPEHVGIVCSNAYGSLEAITELDRVALLEDPRYINPSRFPLTVANSPAGYASIWEEMRAVNVSVSDGNCGALDAVACADTLLEHERARALVVGGAEAMSEALRLAFRKMGALGGGALLGEGAALVVLEAEKAARKRDADILAEIIGYGTSFVPPERESCLLFPSAAAMQNAIAAALEDAALKDREVDLVVSGVSGLRAFDDAELLAIRSTLGDAPVVSPKRQLGETLGAAGAMGILVAVAFLQATAAEMNLRGGVRTLSGTIRTPLRHAVVTSLGYYGNASALVIRAPSR